MGYTHNAEAIRKRREQLGLSGRQLGERIGVDASTISRYENGETQIKYDRIVPLAKALNMDVGELMGWPTPEPIASDDNERLRKALKKQGVIRVDGSVDFRRIAQIESYIKASESFIAIMKQG